MSKPKREHVPRDPRVVVRTSGGRSNTTNGTSNGVLNDISRTGALILTDKPLPVGTTIDLKHALSDDDATTIEGVAEVVRNHANPVGMGVVFIMLTDDSRSKLKTFLERRRG
ncbi:MAG: PilZ domain-containing protein [Kofleriaceae bacterium]